MKKLVILTSSNINGLNGAAKFCKWMNEGKSYFKENSIDISIYSNSNDFSDGQKYTKTMKHKIKQIIKNLLNKTNRGRRIAFFEYYIKKLAFKPLRNFEQSNTRSQETSVLINDIFIAGEFYKRYGNKYNTIFMMHNSGELLSMFCEEMRDAKIRKYLENTEKDIYKYSNKIVFVSESARKSFCEVHSDISKKTICIYNGVPELNVCLNKRSYDKLNLIMVGTVCDRKNQISAIKAVKNLNRDDITLTIVGNGPAYINCKKFIDLYGLQNRVFLVGAQSNITSFLERANAYLLTSFDEGLPISAQEAMNAHLPLIVTNVGGCTDLINGNGILIKPDLEDIVSAIKYFYDGRSRLYSLGEESYGYFKSKFTIQSMYNGYISMLNKM